MTQTARKPFFYALFAVVLFFALIIFFPYKMAWKTYNRNAIVRYFKDKAILKEAAENLLPHHKRILIENPRKIADEQILKGNFTPIGRTDRGTFAPQYKEYAIGIKCPANTDLDIIDEQSGCFRDLEKSRLIFDRISIYNHTLVSSPAYKGNCK